MNPSYKLGKHRFLGEKSKIFEHDYNKYLVRRNIEGLTKNWQYQCKKMLDNYLHYVDWKIDEDRTLAYIQELMEKHSLSYYKKYTYQICRFLRFLNVNWVTTIKLPPDPEYKPKRIAQKDIIDTLSLFGEHEYFFQIRAIIALGTNSGLRALELYQLRMEDIDLDNRVIHVNHNPTHNQSTKTKHSRISFITDTAKIALEEYFNWFNNGDKLVRLFSQNHISRIFNVSNVKIKDLRKYFSQEWDRRGGPTSIKKILMGHSMKGDVDLMHYNYQSPEDLKQIYDNVMNTGEQIVKF